VSDVLDVLLISLHAVNSRKTAPIVIAAFFHSANFRFGYSGCSGWCRGTHLPSLVKTCPLATSPGL
jgi:hypothetical protein